MTPLMLAKAWNVTSVIRDPSQEQEIIKLGEGHKGQVETLVSSLEDVKSDADAQKVLDAVKPNYVVWSAGAGGKGGPDRTYAIDRDAAKHFIASSFATPSVTKFLTVSYIGSRRDRAAWWDDEDWADARHKNEKVLVTYHKAKVAVDEFQAALAKKKRDGGDTKFQSICFRPGILTDDSPTGKVKLGHITSRGKITRADVAAVAVALLERDDTRGWLDALQGEQSIDDAVQEAVQQGIDCMEGEDVPKL